MNTQMQQDYIHILQSELIPAMGCTEPIAIAYAAAQARRVLGEMPTSMKVYCSGNIIKNVMGVVVPNTNGMRGIDVAAIMGMLSGASEAQLSVLEKATAEHAEQMKKLLAQGFCECIHVEEENLYVCAEVFSHEHSASVEIRGKHTNISSVIKDGKRLVGDGVSAGTASTKPDLRDKLNVKDILAFADIVELDQILPLLKHQLSCNVAIAEEGIKGEYGESVGKILLDSASKDDIATIASAMAAAGSDARMNGCSMPVVINSGSGNQGITASVPIKCYAEHYNIPEDRMYRALIVSNLISIHQKRYIGSLSAYCGAVSAACGCAAGIAYMLGASYDEIAMTITNTIATIGGMVCDGAKSSCAAKIAAALRTAITAYEMSRHGKVFRPGEGLVKDNVESTIASVGRMGRVGMHGTDREILQIMLER